MKYQPTSFKFKIKSALLVSVMRSPMFGWVTEKEMKELR